MHAETGLLYNRRQRTTEILSHRLETRSRLKPEINVLEDRVSMLLLDGLHRVVPAGGLCLAQLNREQGTGTRKRVHTDS